MLARRLQSPPGVQAPQSCSARFPLTPARAFVPRACKRSKATPRPRHPLTVSSFLELRLSTGPVALSPGPGPCPPSGPDPRLPAPCRAPTQLQPQQSGRSGLAVRSQRAPPGPGRPLPPLRPLPFAAQAAGTNSARGRQRPRRAARTRGAGVPHPSRPAAAAPSSPGASALQGPRGQGGKARSVRPALCAVPLPPRW